MNTKSENLLHFSHFKSTRYLHAHQPHAAWPPLPAAVLNAVKTRAGTEQGKPGGPDMGRHQKAHRHRRRSRHHACQGRNNGSSVLQPQQYATFLPVCFISRMAAWLSGMTVSHQIYSPAISRLSLPARMCMIRICLSLTGDSEPSGM